MKAPCELVIWYVLPAIRRELAKSMVEDWGMSQRAAANRLGLTDAAVSQYLSEKRGKVKLNDPVVLKQIKYSAKRLSKGNKDIVLKEMCRVCTMTRKRGMLKGLYECSLERGFDVRTLGARN